MFCLSRLIAVLLPDFLYTMLQNPANRTISLKCGHDNTATMTSGFRFLSGAHATKLPTL
jgi:hypothetical protein